MASKFDFLVVASHGSGIHAFEYYSRMIKNLRILNGNQIKIGNYKKIINDFLRDKQNFIKGLIIDRAFAADLILEEILANTGNKFSLVILYRSPLDAAISVANTTLFWYAGALSGVFDIDYRKTKFHKLSSREKFFKFIINAPTLISHSANLPRLLPVADDVQAFHISALSPRNIVASMDKISKMRHIGSDLQNFRISGQLPWSRENTFVSHIRPLTIQGPDGEMKIKPCPEIFLQEYGFSKNDIVFSMHRDQYNFSLGNFEGAINLVDCGPCGNAAQRRKVTSILENNPAYVADYCAEINERYCKAKKIADKLYFSPKSINLMPECGDDLKKYIYNFTSAIARAIGKIRN